MDELNKALENEEARTKIKKQELIFKKMNGDVDKALKLSKQAMQIAKQQKNTKLKTEARLYENMSLYYKGTNLGKLKNSLNTVVNYYEKLENRSGEDTQNTSPLVTIWL